GGNSINTSSQYVKNEKSCSTELISSNNIGKTFYKILNPNFRKKYVHRQPSPTMIRHMYSSVQDQSQQNAQQFVLLHRANQLNQTPRASSAPPTQNQQIHGVNGVPLGGRGRPASVDIDTSITQHNSHNNQLISQKNIINQEFANA
uniref:Uncharacterized protein n=1 Tax=Megaselia scalaris TaxID=36166 RepID=T1H015_MEGSC